jgi:hypothetical protein
MPQEEQRFAYSVSNMVGMTNYKFLQSSHEANVAAHSTENEERSISTDYVEGNHYTAAEKEAYAARDRVPIVLNQFPSSRRTIIGTFLNNKFDKEFVPVEKEDQELSDLLESLAIHEEYTNDDLMKDAELAVQAWIGGNSFLFAWPETAPMQKPYTCTSVLNPFGVYWDPDSKDVIKRSDANFVDVVNFMSIEDIQYAWPEAKINPDLTVVNDTNSLVQSYEEINKSKDRGHESVNYRNGKYKVVERFYRVKKKVWVTLDNEDNVLEVKDVQKFREFAKQSGAPLFQKVMEFIHVVQWAQDVTIDQQVLFNGAWYAQPREPQSQKIIWPILELCSESLGGKPIGFVAPLRDTNKLLDVLTTQLIESAKHAPTSYDVDPDAYLNPKEAEKAIKYGPFASMRFKTKPGMAGKGMVPIQKTAVSPDITQGINYAKDQFDAQSSTPPPMQGLSDSNGNISGVLNAQRIEQASVQMVGFIQNFKAYRKRLMELRYAYWREFYTMEMAFRVTGKDGESKQFTINQVAPKMDQFGEEVPGELTTLNDINAAIFDVRLTDSVMSPTYREKQVAVLSTLIPQIMPVDPVMGGKLIEFWLELSDASNDVKQFIRDRNAEKQQQQQAQEQQMAEANGPVPTAGAPVAGGQDIQMNGQSADVQAILNSIGGNVANAA